MIEVLATVPTWALRLERNTHYGVQNIKKLINWKLFWILIGASSLSVIAVFPYILTLQADLLKELPLPLPILLFIQILQNVVLFAIFIFVGLYLAKRVGLGVSILESWLGGQETRSSLKSILGISITLGVLVWLFHCLFKS